MRTLLRPDLIAAPELKAAVRDHFYLLIVVLDPPIPTGTVLSCFMTSREIFGLILRVCGLVLVYRAGLGLLVPIIMVFGPGRLIGGLSQVIVPIITFAISLYLLRGAPALVRFCYPRET